MYEGISIEQANEHLPFPLIAPDPPPPPFTLSSIIVHGPVTADSSSSEALLEYSLSNADDQTVVVYQTSGYVGTPAAEAMQEAALIGAEPSSVPLPSPSQEQRVFGERPVQKTTIYTPDGTPLLTYTWVLNDLHFDLTGSLTEGLTVEDLERLVAAFIPGDDADRETIPTLEMPDPKAPEVVATFPPVDIPELTEDEKARIVAIAEQNPYVQEAFAGRDYMVETIGVWHTEDTLEKVGGGVNFRFAEPATIEMDWPTRKKDPDSGSYSTCTRHFRATHVTELHVLVDLNREKVASMGPGHDAEITGTPDVRCGGS